MRTADSFVNNAFVWHDIFFIFFLFWFNAVALDVVDFSFVLFGLILVCLIWLGFDLFGFDLL